MITELPVEDTESSELDCESVELDLLDVLAATSASRPEVVWPNPPAA
jgi:hypothetical protein